MTGSIGNKHTDARVCKPASDVLVIVGPILADREVFRHLNLISMSASQLRSDHAFLRGLDELIRKPRCCADRRFS
jgi:hypothetical protein